MVRERTLDEEQRAFDDQLPALLEAHEGEFILFKDGKVVAFFPDEDLAYETGLDQFGLDSLFLVSRVERTEPRPISLSWELGVMFGA